MRGQGSARPAGTLTTTVHRAFPGELLSFADTLAHGTPQRGLPERVNDWRSDNRHHLMRGVKRVESARRLGIPTLYGRLWLRHKLADGRVIPYGLASLRVVTDTGVAAIVDAFTNTFELELFNFHGIGTGAVAEASTDTALGAESTTALNPDNTRATGTPSQPSANVYRTVGTNTVDAAVAATEHGVFSQAATGGGVLLDRSVFAVINLSDGDSLETTYDLTVNAGG